MYKKYILRDRTISKQIVSIDTSVNKCFSKQFVLKNNPGAVGDSFSNDEYIRYLPSEVVSLLLLYITNGVFFSAKEMSSSYKVH